MAFRSSGGYMVWKTFRVSVAAIAVMAGSGLGSRPVAAQAPAKPAAPAKSSVPKEFLSRPPSITRKTLDQKEVGDYVLTMALVNVPVGGREGRHRHDGILIGLVEEGVLSMDHEPTGVRDYKPGETFYIPEGQIHEGFNKGTVPTKVIGSFVIRKGQPMAVPMPLP
jgi:quercetin dioxygenase-like cupin family protein